MAIALLRKCQLAGLSGHYVRAISLMDRLRAARSFNARPEEAQLVDRLAAVDVLVVDDVGKSLGNDFERSSFFNVIDMRWGARKPTIVTTNEPPEVLRDLLTPAGFDRLTEAGAGVLHLDWPS
ncbi:ATP-binding protein, partial [Escherichia coli]|uniref:ATP-binding protein n=1 Tax=Escherichia coli TaxID=562 RepID=UPI002245814A